MKRNKSLLHPDTTILHQIVNNDIEINSTTPPVYQNTAFAYKYAEELEKVFAGYQPGYTYSRIANPTVTMLENRVATLENGLAAVACSSGMSAITATILSLAGNGDETGRAVDRVNGEKDHGIGAGWAFSGGPVTIVQPHDEQGHPAGAIPGFGGGAKRLEGCCGIGDHPRSAGYGGVLRNADAREIGHFPGCDEIARDDKGQVSGQ